MRYGFVGAGELTTAVVTGLCADVADPPEVFLSPRGRDIGRELAGRFPTVRVCERNQDVLDHATTVVLAVRPPQAPAVLAELSFRPEHVVVSALAGVRLAQLREWTAPAATHVRSIPLPAAAYRQSLTALYPDDAVARELFERVGGVLVPADEATLDVVQAATATFAAHLDYLGTIAGWLADQGMDPGTATEYTRHIFGQLGQTLLRSTDSFTAVTERYMTPGGINEQLLTDLRGAGVPGLVRRALDRVLDRLRGSSTTS